MAGRGFAVALLVGLLPLASFAARPTPPPPPPLPAPAAVECFPACRTGFFCSQGQCLSACNPPCGASQQCLETGACAAPPADAPRQAGPPKGPTVNAEGERAPPGHHFEMKRRKGLLISGTAIFGVGYVFSAVYGLWGWLLAGGSGFTFTNRTTYLAYAIPLAGPAVSQLLFANAPGYQHSSSRVLEFMWAGLLTVLQVTGAALATLGLVFQSEVLVEDVRVSFAPFAPGAPFGVTLRVDN